MFVLRLKMLVFGSVILVFGTNVPAQDNPIEFGIDGGVSLTFIDKTEGNAKSIQIPLQRMRVGFFTSESFALETSAAISVIDVGSNTVTQIEIGLAAHSHFSKKHNETRPFFGPVGGFRLINFGSGGGSIKRLGIGSELGVKFPLSHQLAARIGLIAMRWFETDRLLGITQVSVSVGLSFLTK